MIPCDTKPGTVVECIDDDYGVMPLGYSKEALNALPRKGRRYTIREIVPANIGPCGARLLEVQNPTVGTYIGDREPIFGLHRFKIVENHALFDPSDLPPYPKYGSRKYGRDR